MNPAEDDLVYEARARLYRFDPVVKQWKEAGDGPLKIVQNKENWQRIRVMMWRDGVLKVACNHLITKTMVIDYFQQSNTNLSWMAVDFKEADGKYIKFACKFWKSAHCKSFKKYFEEAVAIMKLDARAVPVRLQPPPEPEQQPQTPVNPFAPTIGTFQFLRPSPNDGAAIPPTWPPIDLK